MTNHPQLSIEYFRSIFRLIVVTLLFAAIFTAQEVLIPLMLSVLVVIIVAPVLFRLERLGLPRLWAVICTCGMLFIVFATIGVVSVNQLWSLIEKVPEYKVNLIARIDSMRPSKDNTLSKAITAFGQVESALHATLTSSSDAESGRSNETRPTTESSNDPIIDTQKTPSSEPTAPTESSPVEVRVVNTASTTLEQLSSWMNPILGPLGTMGLVAVLVIFILLNLEDLQERFTRLAGDAALPRSNIALNDAIYRVSRYIQMTFVVNMLYGVTVATGLSLIGIPNAIFWGVAGSILRFVPYLGATITFALPLAVSLAATPTWTAPILTTIFFLVLELILNNVIEPLIYGHSTGVSPVGIIVGSIFWAWAWGPVGLILATPMTVLLVVVGRHFPQLQFMTTLFAEKDSFQTHDELFQHLLSEDDAKAESLAAQYSEPRTLQSVCDDLYLPVLQLVYQHRKSKRIVDSVCQSICERVLYLARTCDTKDYTSSSSTPAVRNSRPIVIVPGRHLEDKAVAELLRLVMQDRGLQIQLKDADLLSSELLEQLVSANPESVIFSTMEGAQSILFRTTIRRIRQTELDVKFIVNRWGVRQGRTTSNICNEHSDLCEIGTFKELTASALESLQTSAQVAA